MNFNEMDDLVLYSVFSNFVASNDVDSDFQMICQLMRVNKRFYALLKSPYFWSADRIDKDIARLIGQFNRHHIIEPMAVILKPLPTSNLATVVQEYYANFVDRDQETIFRLIIAANKLNIMPLLDLTCAAIACMIKGKSPTEIRAVFNIVNDFTPEEEAAVREENAWCDEV